MSDSKLERAVRPLADDAPQVALGRRVRDLRRQLGLTQQELAHRAGMHWTYLSGIERGQRNPALVNVTRLADALDVSLAELFSVLTQRPCGPDRTR